MTPTPYEQDIEQALDTLREAQPAPGMQADAFAVMNARLLRNVPCAVPQRSNPWSEWLTLPRLAFAATAISAVWLGVRVLPVSHPASGAPSVTASSSRVGSAGWQPKIDPLSQRKSAHPFPKSSSFAATQPNPNLSAEATAKTSSMDPAFLPSRPAPEEPLTHQEKLLLKAANGHEDTLFALLEPTQPGLTSLHDAVQSSPLFSGFPHEPQHPPPSTAQTSESQPAPDASDLAGPQPISATNESTEPPQLTEDPQ